MRVPSQAVYHPLNSPPAAAHSHPTAPTQPTLQLGCDHLRSATAAPSEDRQFRDLAPDNLSEIIQRADPSTRKALRAVNKHFAQEVAFYHIAGIQVRNAPALRRAIARFPHARSVDLTNCQFLSEADFKMLAAHKPLRKLHLPNTGSVKNCDFNFAWLRSFSGKQLDHLDCSNVCQADEDFQILRTIPLKKIDFGATAITDHALGELADLPLEHLSTSSSAITDAGLQQLAGKALKHLHMPRSMITPAGLVHLKGMPLAHLSVCGALLDASVFTEIAGLPLRNLGLSKAKINPVSLSKLGNMPLESLQLTFADLRSARLQDLRGLPLQRLSLDWTRCRSEDLAGLVGLPLTHLNLNATPVDDTCFQHLADMPLTELTLPESFAPGGRFHQPGMPFRANGPYGGITTDATGVAHVLARKGSPASRGSAAA